MILFFDKEICCGCFEIWDDSVTCGGMEKIVAEKGARGGGEIVRRDGGEEL